MAVWVNTQIRRKQEGSSLIGASLEEAQRVVWRTITGIFEAQSAEKCTGLFKALSNEVTHLQALYGSLSDSDGEEAVKDLQLALFKFKDRMTEAWEPPDSPERKLAYEEAGAVRHHFLAVSLKVASAAAD